jgi:hypothetical protein
VCSAGAAKAPVGQAPPGMEQAPIEQICPCAAHFVSAIGQTSPRTVQASVEQIHLGKAHFVSACLE